METIPSGSFANNLFPISQKKKYKSILFISEWGPFKKPFHKNHDGYKKFHECDIFFVKYLNKFCINNDYKFFILGRPQTSARMVDEINFYNQFLDRKEWEYIRPEIKQKDSYKEIDKHEIIASISSTLGYESLARRNKTIIFGGRDSYSFGWPKKIEDNGFFWTAKYSHEELNRIMNFLMNIDEEKWKNMLNPIIKEIMVFDKNNKIFFERLGKIENLRDCLIK